MRPETLEWMEKAQGDFQTATSEALVAEVPNFDAVCFHAQQSAEKYLKAVLVEHCIYFPKTHDLEGLLTKVCGVASEASSLVNSAKSLTDYGTIYRYPGSSSDNGAAAEAWAIALVFLRGHAPLRSRRSWSADYSETSAFV
jgi:HEPN domain-containing protein